MNDVWAVIFLFMGSTPDGATHFGVYTIGPVSLNHCEALIEGAQEDDEIGPLMKLPGSKAGCLHDKSVNDVVKACKQENISELPNHVLATAYHCEYKHS